MPFIQVKTTAVLDAKKKAVLNEEVERYKKVWISSEVIMTDNVEITVDNLINDIVEYGSIMPDKISVIRNMNLKKLNKIRKDINFDNSSIVVLIPEKQSKSTN